MITFYYSYLMGNIYMQENNGGETKEEEPLVDLTEKAPEATKSEEPAAESKLEAVPEDEAKEEKKEVKAPAAAPASEDKSDAPLVTL